MKKKVGIIILSLVILCGLYTQSKAVVISYNYSYSTNYVNKNSTDKNNLEQKKENYNYNYEYDYGSLIIKALMFGFIASTVACIINGLKHKPVKISENANEYLDNESINITSQYDNYINSTTEKERINRR